MFLRVIWMKRALARVFLKDVKRHYSPSDSFLKNSLVLVFLPIAFGKIIITYQTAGREEEYQERYEENADEESDVVRRKIKSRSKSAGNIGRIRPKERHRSKSFCTKDISRRKHSTRDYDD